MKFCWCQVSILSCEDTDDRTPTYCHTPRHWVWYALLLVIGTKSIWICLQVMIVTRQLQASYHLSDTSLLSNNT